MPSPVDDCIVLPVFHLLSSISHTEPIFKSLLHCTALPHGHLFGVPISRLVIVPMERLESHRRRNHHGTAAVPLYLYSRST